MAKNSEEVEARQASRPQDSTTKIPMVDIEAAIALAINIRERALETATMDEVAKELGYSSQTSTPFYRRITAARMFNLIAEKSSLSKDMVDYIRPDDEQMKARVLMNAVFNVSAYRDLLARYANKKLNVDLAKNAIAKEHNLTDACAMVCAKAFESTLRFAGLMSSDGIVHPALDGEKAEKGAAPITGGTEGSGVANGNVKDRPDDDPSPELPNTHRHTLYLDKEKARSFQFSGPLEISRAEFERICRWLEFTMLIVDRAPEELRPK